MTSQNPSDEGDSFKQLIQDLDRLPAVRPDLAEAIFAQTRGVLTQRRWIRRGRMVLVCLMFYAVGVGSGWLLRPAAPQVGDQHGPPAVQRITESPLPAKRHPGRLQRDAKTPTASVTESPPAATQPPAQTIAKSLGGSSFEVFRRAGDRQLFERGNIRGAMDCYRRALTHASEHQLRVEVDRDSWLLMSLKQSRMEERKHVRQKRV